eukprot:6120192-Amphidinium_carterae.1
MYKALTGVVYVTSAEQRFNCLMTSDITSKEAVTTLLLRVCCWPCALVGLACLHRVNGDSNQSDTAGCPLQQHRMMTKLRLPAACLVRRDSGEQ